MSRLDDELAEAVAEAQASEPEPVVSPATQTPARGSVALVVGLLVAGGAILTLVLTSLSGSTVYARNVDELVRDKEKLAGRTVKLQGTLVKGSMRKRDEPCEYRFELEAAGKRMPVHFPKCVLPDTVSDVPGMDVQVTATGKLADGGHFQAADVIGKCPSKYEMQERAKKGENIPHDAISTPPPVTAL
jgi:cytochrome c-type biogenesis protein CcmE